MVGPGDRFQNQGFWKAGSAILRLAFACTVMLPLPIRSLRWCTSSK